MKTIKLEWHEISDSGDLKAIHPTIKQVSYSITEGGKNSILFVDDYGAQARLCQGPLDHCKKMALENARGN